DKEGGMSAKTDGAGVCLSISSELMSPDEIAAQLGFTPRKSFVKGTPTGQRDVPLHPCHIAMFMPDTADDSTLEEQLEATIAMCEPIKHRLVKMTASCGVTIFCNYWVETQGGWTISPELCRRMAALPLHYVFGVETKKKASRK